MVVGGLVCDKKALEDVTSSNRSSRANERLVFVRQQGDENLQDGVIVVGPCVFIFNQLLSVDHQTAFTVWANSMCCLVIGSIRIFGMMVLVVVTCTGTGMLGLRCQTFFRTHRFLTNG